MQKTLKMYQNSARTIGRRAAIYSGGGASSKGAGVGGGNAGAATRAAAAAAAAAVRRSTCCLATASTAAAAPSEATAAMSRRSAAAAAAAAAAALALAAAPAPARAAGGGVDPALAKAFADAMAAQGDFDAMERAWTRAVELAPDNAAALSNRGTARLQAGRWRDAYDDLSAALALEERRFGSRRVADGVSALLYNQLGNAEGALGMWDAAMASYKEAAEDPEMESIAAANYALAAFETGRTSEAVREARQLLRR